MKNLRLMYLVAKPPKCTSSKLSERVRHVSMCWCREEAHAASLMQLCEYRELEAEQHLAASSPTSS